MALAPVPTVPNTTRRATYSPVASAGPFAVSFTIWGDATDLRVTLDGVIQSGNWSLATAAPLGQPFITDGTITFTGPITGSLIIEGRRAPRRLANSVEGQDTARSRNIDMNGLYATLREMFDRVVNAISVAPGDPEVTLPPRASLANKLFGFDGSGNPSFVAPASGGVVNAAGILDASANGRSLITAANYAAMKVLLALDAVNNTTDANKPVSTAQAAAISAAVAAGVAGLATAASVVARPVPDAIIEDQKSSATAGGGFTSGADQTRALNTKVRDPNNIVTLSSNQISLGAGTYFFKWSAPAAVVDKHQSFLYNVTDAVEVKRGTPEYSPSTASGNSTRSIGGATVTIAATKLFEIRHRCQTTRVTDGFGLAAGFGIEVFTIVEIFKLA